MFRPNQITDGESGYATAKTTRAYTEIFIVRAAKQPCGTVGQFLFAEVRREFIIHFFNAMVSNLMPLALRACGKPCGKIALIEAMNMRRGTKDI